jgi:hypothetical protein
MGIYGDIQRGSDAGKVTHGHGLEGEPSSDPQQQSHPEFDPEARLARDGARDELLAFGVSKKETEAIYGLEVGQRTNGVTADSKKWEVTRVEEGGFQVITGGVEEKAN